MMDIYIYIYIFLLICAFMLLRDGVKRGGFHRIWRGTFGTFILSSEIRTGVKFGDGEAEAQARRALQGPDDKCF